MSMVILLVVLQLHNVQKYCINIINDNLQTTLTKPLNIKGTYLTYLYIDKLKVIKALQKIYTPQVPNHYPFDIT